MDHAVEPPAGRNHRILVTGGTGTLGRQVIPRLRDAGCKVRVLSRGSREGAEGLEFVTGDLATGEGIDAAVAGTEIIVHLAGSAKGDEVKARHLVRAASRAGARHLVYISVVGAGRIPVVSPIDRAMFGYFAAKRAAEQVIAGTGLPWTTLRATQLHDLTLLTVRQLARLPVLPVPAGFRVQPIDAGEVAARLAELAWARRPAWCPTWASHGCTSWLTCCAATCEPRTGTGRSCRSGRRAGPPARSGPAPTSPPTGRWATAPGRTSWPTG
jgi:uncharacterized protein YbjT (DUF2867 family)